MILTIISLIFGEPGFRGFEKLS